MESVTQDQVVSPPISGVGEVVVVVVRGGRVPGNRVVRGGRVPGPADLPK